MKKYINPKIEIFWFEDENVITTSGPVIDPITKEPIFKEGGLSDEIH